MNRQQLEKLADAALNALADTDEEHARLKAQRDNLANMKSSVESVLMSDLEGSMASRQMEARASREYTDHLERIYKADLDFFKLDNERRTWVCQIELYRTICANERKG